MLAQVAKVVNATIPEVEQPVEAQSAGVATAAPVQKAAAAHEGGPPMMDGAIHPESLRPGLKGLSASHGPTPGVH